MSLPSSARPEQIKFRTDTTLRLTRTQYRQFAEMAKAVGKGLNIANHADLRCWGQYGFFAMAIVDDAAQPPAGFKEHALITLSTSINTRQLRAAGRARPECDWSQLADDEIYPFVIHHEVGHVRDNFLVFDLFGKEDPEVEIAKKTLGYINETLADRYAWKQVCDCPMPLTESGKRNADQISADIERLTRITGGRIAGGKRSLPGGQHRSVPDYMLATADRAKWIGPGIHPELLRKTVERHDKYVHDYGYALWDIARKPMEEKYTPPPRYVTERMLDVVA